MMSKKTSFKSTFSKFLPSVGFFQETKMRKTGLIKFPGYQVIEKIRKDKCGGGLMTVVDVDLNPVVEMKDVDINC